MGIYADLSKWTAEQIKALKYITQGEPSDEGDIVDDWNNDVTEALEEASDGDHTPSTVLVLESAKCVEHNSTGDIDAFVFELEMFMAYVKIMEPLVVYYSNNAEGAERHQGFAIVNGMCGVGGAQWSNTLIEAEAQLLRARARIYEHQALIMSLPHVHHITGEEHLLVVRDTGKRVYIVTPGYADRWYIRSASNLLAYTTGMDGKAGPNFTTLVGALDYIENVTNGIIPEG